MKLSELTFQCVKNVKYFDNPGFTYFSFIKGEYDNDLDYANAINNTFAPINQAIHRLSDRRKIKNKINKMYLTNNPNENKILDISLLKNDIKNIVNIFVIQNGEYERVEFRELGDSEILIISKSKSKEYFVEYVQDIPHFKKEDFYYKEIDESKYEIQDINLKEYGITETMCSYIIEFVQGKLLEPIAPDLANMHRGYAEQYFADLDEQQTPFYQRKISKVYKI